MVFVEIREGYVNERGIKQMTKDFQQILLSGGINVGMSATNDKEMVAVTHSIRELQGIIKFAT